MQKSVMIYLATTVSGGGMMDDQMIDRMVYTAEDIQKILGLGRSVTYTFLEKTFSEQKPFKVLKVGKMYRVPKKGFDQWLNGE